MKTKFFLFTFFACLFASGIFAQDRTTVTATSNDISDNLDLKAVASIFGDSKDLEDFERRLNDPKMQISNLDLNNDNQVDYLRVIESVEGNTHLIIIQSVLDKDVYQDVATVEVEKDSNNQVQVQVVGDTYMYGDNFVYEPVYVSRPIIYDYFWVGNYHPYYSSWYWGYYPTYYSYWAPYPVYRYRHHVHSYINVSNHYNYVNVRNHRTYSVPANFRGNGYAVRNPNHSFRERNANINNRHELEQVRHNEIRNNTPRNTNGNVRNNNTAPRAGIRTQAGTRSSTNVRSNTTNNPVQNPRSYSTPRSENTSVRTSETPRVETPRAQAPRAESPRVEAPRAQATRVDSRSNNVAPRMNTSRQSQQRSAPVSNGDGPRGGGRR